MPARETEIQAYLKARIQGVDRVSVGDHDGADGVVYLRRSLANEDVRALLNAYTHERVTCRPSSHSSLVPFTVHAGAVRPRAAAAADEPVPTVNRAGSSGVTRVRDYLAYELEVAGVHVERISTPQPGGNHRWSLTLASGISRLEAVSALARTLVVRDVKGTGAYITFVVDPQDRSPLTCGQWP